jgi:intraflagellar transport protein 57
MVKIKSKLEDLEKRSTTANESVVKLTNDLAETTERLEELKESFESKDSGMNDTSPLVRMKGALQQIKKEIYDYDLRIGVVSNTVLMARINTTQRKRIGAVNNAKKRRQKGKKGSASSNYKQNDLEDDED